MRSIVLAVVSLLLGASLVGCGGEDGGSGGDGGSGSDKPAVCGSVDTLKTSVGKLKDIDVTSSGAVSDLESGLTGVQSDLNDVKADAKSEFSSQVAATEKSGGALKTSVDDAKANPSAATLTAVGSTLTGLRHGRRESH